MLRYPPRTLLGDYTRAAVGTSVGVGVLAVNPWSWPVVVVFGGVAVLFGGLGLRALHRQRTRLAVTPDGLVRQGVGTRHYPWTSLRGVKLRYYGTRSERQESGGFSQLTLDTDAGRLTVESNLEDFDVLLYHVAAAVRDHGVGLDPRTAGNMLALGIDPDGETPPSESLRQKLDATSNTPRC